ncbi:MAG: FAD-dependent oxidoreductase [Myxococcales bacterium]|nr:FAD-dependent oxidoreductase [Myxococcales bacterium]
MEHAQAVVIGAGFGGLGASLGLAESGWRVRLFEALRYPGGCASTFTKGQDRFETGATLFAGLGSDGLFGRWLQQHHQKLQVTFPDPVVELRRAEGSLLVDASRDAFIARLCAIPGAPSHQIHRWFALQSKVADALWPVLADPDRLLPLDARGIRWHLSRLPRYGVVLPLVGRSLGDVMRSHGIHDFEPLRTWLNATCQITIQCSADQADAVMALATADYFFRDAGHVHGGIGHLAQRMLTVLDELGAEVSMADPVGALTWLPDERLWLVTSRRHEVKTPIVVANLLPSALAGLLDSPTASLDKLARRVAHSWGACMLYLAVDPQAVQRVDAHHLELIDDTTTPLDQGNHIFCSISAIDEVERCADDSRTITVSTHIPLPAGRLPERSFVEEVQANMWRTLRRRAPELAAGVRRKWQASPRTWQRFTRRPHGRVGGPPRHAGLGAYLTMVNKPIEPGLWLVGDSIFPGQSTLATWLGGRKLAGRLARDTKRSPRLLAATQDDTCS